ncbi:hypothetical protein U3A55_13180 [Salarchaeum sp. III]|uniref:hypothetical protein n=1 Tax=Salarchaeum sp. III TaxID=3107927 RepID=UPI002EDB8638
MAAMDNNATETDEEPEVELQTGNLVAQSLPHRYARDEIEFTVETIQLDGTPLDGRGDLDESDRYLSLVDESNWQTLTLTGTVDVASDTIKEVFPTEEWDDPPGRLALVKTNPLAISRDRHSLADAPTKPDTYEFSIDIPRNQHRGTVTIEPHLVRASDREPTASNCASKAGSRLANGVPWTIDLDRQTDAGGLLMPVIEDFSDSDRLPDDQHIHYLSLDEPRNPQLYLNREHSRVIKVLENEGSTGGPPRLRDILYDYIEHSVWTQLILQTARDTNPDTGEPEYSWQEDVLELFLDDLYPEEDDDDAAAVQLASDIRTIEDLPDLVQKIERAVHRRYDIPADTTKLIEEAIQNDD